VVVSQTAEWAVVFKQVAMAVGRVGQAAVGVLPHLSPFT